VLAGGRLALWHGPVRWVRRTLAPPGAIVLLYHRIGSPSPDPWSLNVSPHHFAEHLDVLRRHMRIVPLRELAGEIPRRGQARRPVAITFDDGYADNLATVTALLRRHDATATIFCTTGLIGREGEYWWDVLERIFLHPGRLPASLTLTIEGATRTWQLDADAEYGGEAARRHRDWRAGQAPPTGRHALYFALWNLLHALPTATRQDALDALVAWAGISDRARPTHRVLTRAEDIAMLAGEGMIEIGAHTVSHPSLARLPVTAQRAEIRESKARLEALTGCPVTSFAYPFGGPSDYTPETVAQVREAGFERACANFSGRVTRSSDRYQIPRLYVRDGDGEAFASRLTRWCGPLVG